MGERVVHAGARGLGGNAAALAMTGERVADLQFPHAVDFAVDQAAVATETVLGFEDKRPAADSVLGIAAKILLNPLLSVLALETVREEAHVFVIAKNLA